VVLEVESELNVLDDGAELGDVEEDDEEANADCAINAVMIKRWACFVIFLNLLRC
jgi:hypothetical protein